MLGVGISSLNPIPSKPLVDFYPVSFLYLKGNSELCPIKRLKGWKSKSYLVASAPDAASKEDAIRKVFDNTLWAF